MRYQSDVTDSQWESLKDYFSVGKYGNRRIHPVREMVNAVFYVIKSSCQWRMLPKDFPPFSAVFAFYNRCKSREIWEKIRDDLVTEDRLRQGRNASPSLAIIDSQSVKTTGALECRGIDGGKKIKGRKRHIAVDADGHLLHIKVHAANTHDIDKLL
ncbi:MAG: IS5 family transposase [Holosporaceae bacterium]|jgi:putative transposase|nr:IS5 family transposase [Holosporaceae bacterium]